MASTTSQTLLIVIVKSWMNASTVSLNSESRSRDSYQMGEIFKALQNLEVELCIMRQ